MSATDIYIHEICLPSCTVNSAVGPRDASQGASGKPTVIPPWYIMENGATKYSVDYVRVSVVDSRPPDSPEFVLLLCGEGRDTAVQLFRLPCCS